MQYFEELSQYTKHCINVLEAETQKLFNFQTVGGYTWHLDRKKTKVTKRRAVSRGGFGVTSLFNAASCKSHRGDPYAFVRINMGNHVGFCNDGNNYKMPFKEYSHYATDSEIGDVAAVTRFEYAQLIVLHEIAHAIQYYMVFWDDSPLRIADGNNTEINCHAITQQNKGHRKLFQDIYRVLRVNLFNNGYRVSQPKYTARQRKVAAPAKAIGKVKITDGRYRGEVIFGEFDLVKPYQAHAKPKLQHGFHYFGFVTVMGNKRKFRVNVLNPTCVQLISNMGAGA